MIESNIEDFNKLFNMEVFPLKEIFTKQNLYDVELSPVNSLGKDFVLFFILFILWLTHFSCNHEDGFSRETPRECPEEAGSR